MIGDADQHRLPGLSDPRGNLLGDLVADVLDDLGCRYMRDPRFLGVRPDFVVSVQSGEALIEVSTKLTRASVSKAIGRVAYHLAKLDAKLAFIVVPSIKQLDFSPAAIDADKADKKTEIHIVDLPGLSEALRERLGGRDVGGLDPSGLPGFDKLGLYRETRVQCPVCGRTQVVAYLPGQSVSLCPYDGAVMVLVPSHG